MRTVSGLVLTACEVRTHSLRARLARPRIRSRARVVAVENVRRPGPPGRAQPAYLDADAGMGLDVPHPVGPAAPLRDEPEGLAIQAVADGRAPRLSRAPPGRLQQGITRNRDVQVPGQPDDRIDQPLLQRLKMRCQAADPGTSGAVHSGRGTTAQPARACPAAAGRPGTEGRAATIGYRDGARGGVPPVLWCRHSRSS
jgi:hypothetical protein